MANIDETIKYLQELKSQGHTDVAARIYDYRDLQNYAIRHDDKKISVAAYSDKYAKEVFELIYIELIEGSFENDINEVFGQPEEYYDILEDETFTDADDEFKQLYTEARRQQLMIQKRSYFSDDEVAAMVALESDGVQ